MKYIEKKDTHCAYLDFEYTSDYSPFGVRRFSWHFLRDRNREFEINYTYILQSRGENDTVSFYHSGSICIFCNDGDYIINVESTDKSVITRAIISEENRKGIVITGENDITITSTFLTGSLEIISADPVELFGACSLSFEKKCNGIYIINNIASGNFFEIFNRELFGKNGILDNLICIYDDNFKFKNTFRGMYAPLHPRDSVQLLTCIKGAADIYITDMSSNKKESHVLRLTDPTESILLSKSYAVGVHSLDDDTVLNQMRGEYIDPKYMRRLGIKYCEKTSRLDQEKLIMSVIDRYAEECTDEVV